MVDRNDIKIISIESDTAENIIDIIRQLTYEISEQYGNTYTLTYHNPLGGNLSLDILDGISSGGFCRIFRDVKAETLETLKMIKRYNTTLKDRKHIHIVYPNLYSMLSIYSATTLNLPNDCSTSKEEIHNMRTNGLFGFSYKGTQVLDIFEDNNYKDFDFDLVVKLTDDKCRYTYAASEDFMDKYVTNYLLRKDCTDPHLNGRVIKANFDYSDKNQLKEIASLITTDINLFGVK